jgi:hypothetical protein
MRRFPPIFPGKDEMGGKESARLTQFASSGG